VPLHLHKNHCAIKAIETPSFSSEEEDQPLNRKVLTKQHPFKRENNNVWAFNQTF
jgi:hypothetical protein